MKPVALGCAVGLLVALCASQAAAQSLAEIARQEKLRRAALAENAAAEDAAPKVYTNADLRGGGRLTTSEGPVPPAAAAGAADTAATPPAEDAAQTAGASTAEDQWQNRINAVRQARDRAELMAEALQNRVDGLLAEFTSRDDPAQRAVIGQDRQAALEELENTRAEIDDLARQIADIQEEARRASVPPGWLR